MEGPQPSNIPIIPCYVTRYQMSTIPVFHSALIPAYFLLLQNGTHPPLILHSETSIGIPNPKPRILQRLEFKQAHEGPLIPSDMDKLPEDLSIFKCISMYIDALAWLQSYMSLPMAASPYHVAVCSITCTTG